MEGFWPSTDGLRCIAWCMEFSNASIDITVSIEQLATTSYANQFSGPSTACSLHPSKYSIFVLYHICAHSVWSSSYVLKPNLGSDVRVP